MGDIYQPTWRLILVYSAELRTAPGWDPNDIYQPTWRLNLVHLVEWWTAPGWDPNEPVLC